MLSNINTPSRLILILLCVSICGGKIERNSDIGYHKMSRLFIIVQRVVVTKKEALTHCLDCALYCTESSSDKKGGFNTLP